MPEIGEQDMFMELHYHTDRDFRRLDLADKMAERRKQSLAAIRRDPPRLGSSSHPLRSQRRSTKSGAWPGTVRRWVVARKRYSPEKVSGE
jgi:hypothetical protein